MLTCPSDPPNSINTGVDGPAAYQANGWVLRDDYVWNANVGSGTYVPANKGYSIDYISAHDGSTQTLMLSENLSNFTISASYSPSSGTVQKYHNWWGYPETLAAGSNDLPSPGSLVSGSPAPHRLS